MNGATKKKGKRKPGAQTREAIAHHEAGHFVADYFHAMVDNACEITIAPSGDAAGSNNRSEHPIDEWTSSGQAIERHIVGLFAGYAAEVRFDPSRIVVARAVASDDDAKAEVALGWIAKSEPERERRRDVLRSSAGSLVEEHWAAVAALARELLKRTTLDAYEATWIVAIAEGEQAKVELAEYRRLREAHTARRPVLAAELRRLKKTVRRGG